MIRGLDGILLLIRFDPDGLIWGHASKFFGKTFRNFTRPIRKAWRNIKKRWRNRGKKQENDSSDEIPSSLRIPKEPKKICDKKEKEVERLREVEKELRKQLDNGKNQIAKERSQGRKPNPHGLGKEVNETIPEQIRKVVKRINDLNN